MRVPALRSPITAWARFCRMAGSGRQALRLEVHRIESKLLVDWRERITARDSAESTAPLPTRSEEHTSELQSLAYLVCRLLLEKKKKKKKKTESNRMKRHIV